MEKEFFAQLDNPLLGKAFKLAMIAEWLAANSIDVSTFSSSNIFVLSLQLSSFHYGSEVLIGNTSIRETNTANREIISHVNVEFHFSARLIHTN